MFGVTNKENLRVTNPVIHRELSFPDTGRGIEFADLISSARSQASSSWSTVVPRSAFLVGYETNSTYSMKSM